MLLKLLTFDRLRAAGVAFKPSSLSNGRSKHTVENFVSYSSTVAEAKTMETHAQASPPAAADKFAS
uniref:Uncharacterized protein n=2 Tax=Oryza TaxID=4527 RepID=A0A0D3FCS8_9ORYZ